MTPNHTRILYSARNGRLRSAAWEFALAVTICAAVSLLFLVMLGYMAELDARVFTGTPR